MRLPAGVDADEGLDAAVGDMVTGIGIAIGEIFFIKDVLSTGIYLELLVEAVVSFQVGQEVGTLIDQSFNLTAVDTVDIKVPLRFGVVKDKSTVIGKGVLIVFTVED